MASGSFGYIAKDAVLSQDVETSAKINGASRASLPPSAFESTGGFGRRARVPTEPVYKTINMAKKPFWAHVVALIVGGPAKVRL